MDILIVKLGALGDVLRTTTLARRLKAAHGGARIQWLTSRAALPLLERNPDLEAAFAVEDRPKLSRRFDLVLSLEEDAHAATTAEAACRGELVGITFRGGLRYTPSSALYYDMSALNREADGSLTRADGLKASNRLSYARLWLRILGLPEPADPADLRPVLALTDEERDAAGRGLALAAPLEAAIGFNPGAGGRWPSKQPSPETAAAWARALAALGRPVLLLGGAQEAERNRRIFALAGRGLVDAGTGRSLRAFAALVSRLAAVAATDSLAFHIATAVGRPALALVGPTSAAELDTFGRGEVLAAGPCSCFYRPRCSRPRSCLDELPAERVAQALSPWLKN